ncbi:hypothetical protein [Rhodopirellula baltica]|uniref:Uncharacterized protein n=2 Tax=Rhodopirellula baltica TaxID=265606 RepID=F2AYM2_RHOBT|nr:hypothetical protein [Rhodopirellula baltica]EGF25219.1 hypothetical protein RBWH47_00995 [Rhodopirellula baltica WH47]EKK03702.1 hypothetical protein RBSH_01151 [Rhodopirellula baltica SH28]
MHTSETILAVIPGATEHERMVVATRFIEIAERLKLHSDVVEAEPERADDSRPFCEQLTSVQSQPIVLRQETFSEAVGWFTQSCVEMSREQWDMMRRTMVPETMPAIQRKRSVRRLGVMDADSPSVIPFKPSRAVSA